MPRKTNSIPSNRTVLIVVEGQTERIYFSDMNVCERIPGITIIPKEPAHSDIKHVLETAIREYDSGVYDSIWCVYDKDTFQNDNLKERLVGLMKDVSSRGIRIADSMPSFEIWFLSHFKRPQLYYPDQDSVIEELKKYILDYSKDRHWLERKKIYAFLKEKQDHAFDNCNWLEKARLGYGDNCTCCKVHELVLNTLSGFQKGNRR